ncbi:MAG: YbaB/EbfC family nucleoid-associated protein [Methylobacteriaceae bacterium]|nr:YbaB/EbfC family nucleoid-associated protein [Methylobacteriaceae bacterium]MBV9221177.1 YbaB/EbfC family nucleoid-associated protein [Methylobacteriaceae bacterium]
MPDFLALMKQAQAMQARVQEMQAELDRIEVEGESGAGLVKVSLTGKGAMRAVSIDSSLLRSEEKEVLEDLIVTAHEEARKKAARIMEEKMKSATVGLPLPPGLKLPF